MNAMMQPVLTALWITQSPGEPATNAVAVGIGLLTVLVTVVLAWAIFRGRNLVAQLATLTKKLDDLNGAHRELTDKERKQAKDLEGKRNDLKKFKKDVAAQRKKNHQAAEDNKKLRADLAAARATFAGPRNARPAFAEGEGAKKREAPAPVKTASASNDTGKAVTGTTLKELEERNAQLAAANEKLTQELGQVRGQWDSERGEIKKIKRRIEDYRRIDMINAGKVAALDDRVNHLGRQYYEACTEIAVLKGEVPRVAPPEEQPWVPNVSAAPRRVSEPNGGAAPDDGTAPEGAMAPDDTATENDAGAPDGETDLGAVAAAEGAVDPSGDPSGDESGAAAV